ncbi:zinc finger SWIM domain-containing protein 1 [Hydra vulgaris]|uniref:zinc finger SWIM domain-containing protein 1 n=1 Tax=Hydra vulgaris TaxID=6087 RepID=UPI0032EA0644
MDTFEIGRAFSSFGDLKKAIETLQKTTYSQFYIKDSRSIASALKRTPGKIIKPELKYSYIVFACIAGGKKFVSKSKGRRPNQSTFKMNCPVEIILTVEKDGSCLKVASLNMNHNHQCSKVAFSHLPHQRKLTGSASDEAVKLLKMRCNKIILQNHLKNITGKVITGRDLSNIKAKHVTYSIEKNNVESIVKKLQNNEGSTTEVIADENNNLLGIFYQDQAMKDCFSAFPEMLFIDSTYKLNNLNMPLYILLGEDGNGHSEIFATFLVANEEKKMIELMIRIFKKVNPNWEKTLNIMSDKDMTERQILGIEFPQANLHLCLFHVLRTFRRELTLEKMGITSEQRRLCLEILQKMTYAKTEEDYANLYQSLKSTKINSVICYFEDNWHKIHNEWVEGLKSTNLTFLNRTNNRLESLNQKIKQVCSRNTNLGQFFDDFLVFLQSTRVMQDHKAINIFHKRPVILYEPGSVEESYKKLLTPYAFSFVLKELELASEVRSLKKLPQNQYEVTTTYAKLKVTVLSCDCGFRSAMLLPCRHIFAVRKVEEVDLFNRTLCSPRWSLDYYKSKHHVAKSLAPGNPGQYGVVTSNKKAKTTAILSQNEKYKKTLQLCHKLGSIVSESPMREYENRYDLLANVLDFWKKGIDIGIQKRNVDEVHVENLEHSNDDIEVAISNMNNNDLSFTVEPEDIANGDKVDGINHNIDDDEVDIQVEKHVSKMQSNKDLLHNEEPEDIVNEDKVNIVEHNNDEIEGHIQGESTSKNKNNVDFLPD